MLENVHFDEAKQSQLAMVELLINMGYTYISASDCLAQRSGDTSKFILGDIARASLMRINSYEHNGTELKFTDRDVAVVVDELENVRLEGLIDTSKDIYDTIMPKTGGRTIKVYHDGLIESKDFRFIDFGHVDNNDFHVTVEYRATGKETIRCDIVCFVNGIPFVVIENKKSSEDIEKALSQLKRYQSAEQCPKLFIYPQLLIGTNASKFMYGTTDTPNKFYSNWREKGTEVAEFDAHIQQLIAKPIDTNIYNQLLLDLNGATQGHVQMLARTVKEQDRGTVAMLQKARLLDIAKNFVLYDGGVKKVMRYQQYFAIHKILKRIEQVEPAESGGVKRRGGIVWHTQGSGKSLTMVMFVRALIEDTNIINPRVIVVTDRKDLDRQIKKTFENAGLKKDVIQATSGEDLLEKIHKKESAVITTLVHKFQTAAKNTKRADLYDRDENIFVLVDEAHRTQGGEANLEMLRMIPNACYIAFTGTPLLKKDKSRNKFGEFIDKYTIDDALTDEIVLPLIYEGRYVPLRQDGEEVDRQSDRVMEPLNDKQKFSLQKTVEKRVLQENPRRMKEIFYDIEKHYVDRFQGTGLKAQVVAPSKYAALLLQKYFTQSGKVATALVISDENGDPPEDDEHKIEIDTFLKQIKAKHSSLGKYEESVISSFIDSEQGIEILIVVDKLLTGFDAPRNTVLYLARELKDHNLLQAIARVNRLFENPDYPKTAGYIVDYSENAENIHTAMSLFGNYDETDVKGALLDVNDKIRELEAKYHQLEDIFTGVARDDQAMLSHLADEPTRRDFGDKVNQFLQVFGECLDLKDFADKFDHVDSYKMELKKLHNLKKSAALQYGEYVDLRKYKLELVKIIDENVKAGTAEVLTEEIEITDREKLKQAIEELSNDTSKAEAIAAQTIRRTTERRQQDPELYDKFSARIREIIEAMRAKKLADIEALKQLRLLDDEIESKKDSDLPSELDEHKGADILYRNLRDELFQISDSTVYRDTIIELTEVLKTAATVDWWRSYEVKRRMRDQLDDYLYDVVQRQRGFDLGYEQVEKIIEVVMNLAENNRDIYTR